MYMGVLFAYTSVHHSHDWYTWSSEKGIRSSGTEGSKLTCEYWELNLVPQEEQSEVLQSYMYVCMYTYVYTYRLMWIKMWIYMHVYIYINIYKRLLT